MTIKPSTLKPILIIFTIIGIALPYSAFIPFLVMHGLDIPLLVQHITASKVAAFAWIDVIISAIVLLLMAYSGRIITIKQAVLVTLLTCTVGVSAGLPLFFYFFVSNSDTTKQR